MKRLLTIAGLLLILAGLLCMAVARDAAVRRARKIDQFLVALSRIDRDAVSLTVLRQLAAHFQEAAEWSACTDDACELRLRVDNRPMNAFLFSHVTIFGSIVQMKGSHLVHVDTSMTVIGRRSPPYGPFAHTVEIRPNDPAFPAFGLVFTANDASVTLTSSASLAERAVAYSYDASCIYRLGGCRTSAEIVPFWREIARRRPVTSSPE